MTVFVLVVAIQLAIVQITYLNRRPVLKVIPVQEMLMPNIVDGIKIMDAIIQNPTMLYNNIKLGRKTNQLITSI